MSPNAEHASTDDRSRNCARRSYLDASTNVGRVFDIHVTATGKHKFGQNFVYWQLPLLRRIR